MTCRIHFYLLNDHFSIEFANEHHNGEPSEMNRKYLWEDEFEISQDLDAVEEVADATYALQGTLGDSDFSEHISKMRLFYMNRGGESLAVVGCSEQLLDSCSLEKHDSMFVLKVYLKGEEPLANPVTGIYIASQDFPKSLIV